MQIEDIIFLGAGASASEGAPLQRYLFKKYFQSFRLGSDYRITNEMSQRLVKFFKTFFGIDLVQENFDNTSFPTFEEILGILELAINREESFKHYNLTSLSRDKRIQQIREDLIFLIAIILDKTLIRTVGYHRKLVNRLKNENKLSRTGFISLNYDIIIDNTLVGLYPDYDLDYGVEFTNFEKQNDWKRPNSQRAIYLYKLHGSLNWLFCPTCISLTLFPQRKRVAELIFEPENCDDCNSKMLPIIIPPTFFKVLSNFYLQQVWRKAENALKNTEKIFFCGYSFPDADIHIKYLLKRAEINRGVTPEIFIINGKKTGDQRDLEESRYKRFFKESQKILYTNKSFEDFCQQDVSEMNPP